MTTSTTFFCLLQFLLYIFTSAICHSTPATIIIPCYNEARRLPTTSFLNYIQTHLSCPTRPTFLLVNDGSTDQTLQLLENLKSKDPTSFEILHLSKNQGKAEAVRQGLLHVLSTTSTTAQNGNIIGFWDGDLATPLSSIDVFMHIFHTKPKIEMVFGSRVALLGRDIQRHASRHYLGRIFATLASSLLQLRIYDTQCGAKLFRITPDLRWAVSEPFQSRWIFDVALIARLQNQRLRNTNTKLLPLSSTIYEQPLDSWRDISGSKLSFKHKASALYGLFHIWRKYTSTAFQDWNPSDSSDSSGSSGSSGSDSSMMLFIGFICAFMTTFVFLMYVAYVCLCVTRCGISKCCCFCNNSKGKSNIGRRNANGILDRFQFQNPTEGKKYK